MKAETVYSWSSLASAVERLLFYLFILFIPTQFGKHFWPSFSYVLGSRIDYLSPTIYITDILVVSLFSLVILKRKLSISPLYSISILFIALSISFSTSPFPGWYFLFKYLEISFLIWYVARAQYNRILVGSMLFVGIIFESLLSIAQIISQGSVGGLLYFLGERSFSGSTPGIANASISGQLILRPYGTFSHPNMLAGYFVIVMLLVTYFLRKEQKISQLLIFLSFIFGTIGLALTLSRTAIAAWVLIGLVTIFTAFHKKIDTVILLFTLLVGTTFLLTAIFFPPIISRLLSVSFGESLAERSRLAHVAFAMILNHTFLGVGPNNFISSLPLFSKNEFVLQPVHNIYLLIASELGIPGLLLFLGSLWFLTRKVYRTWKRSSEERKEAITPLLLAFLAILFSGFFDHYFVTLPQGQLLFAIVIGLLFQI